MQGLITAKDVLRHGVMIVRLFGPAAYLRCVRGVLSRKPCTFLALACPISHR